MYGQRQWSNLYPNFILSEDDTRVSDRTVSRKAERVMPTEELLCDGVWLNGVLESMFFTLKSQVLDGYTTYIENPRANWTFLYCCQIVCYVTRTWCTLEAHQAFDQMEDGNENACRTS